jgi:hypothetical protein
LSGNWGSLLPQLIPLALVVALSPFSILPAVLLVVHSARPRATGAAFLVGWLLGLGLMTVIFVEVPRLLGDLNSTPRWAAWTRVGIGALMIVAAVWRWMTRHQVSRGSDAPWLERAQNIRSGNAGLIGFGLTLINIKFLAVCAAAGLAISAARLGLPGTWLAVVLYTLVAGSTAAVPVLAHVLAAERLDSLLERAKTWMQRQSAVLTAVILAVIGVGLVLSGIRAV